MIYYLGNKVKLNLKASDKATLNKLKSWEYGYNKEHDVVIISKDGTLGDVYEVMGLRIGLPDMPKKKDIINHNKIESQQKFVREKMPKELEYSSIDEHTSKFTGNASQKQEQIDEYLDTVFKRHQPYINEQYEKRDKGIWIYLKGKPVYVTGTYWFGVQWVREISEYPNFRVIQNELMIFWEACKADPRCFGMQYVKNRRMGASLLAIMEMIDAATLNEDKLLGMVSKKGEDAGKIFRRYIAAFKRLPSFFRPIWDGTNNPKKKLNLEEATKRKSAGSSISMGNGLGTMVEWHNTDLNAMDGDAIFRSLIDESGKFPKDVPFSKYWGIVKTSHRKGIIITGKSMVVSTVNSLKKGGSEYKKIWDQSDCNKRDANGQTKSGLYRIFIAAKYCLEGMFDEYGFSILEDPNKPIKTDEGVYVEIGAKSFLRNSIEALKDDPEELNEFMRQNPEKVEDAFRNESGDCEFDETKLDEQIEHNNWELNDTYNSETGTWNGNNDVERGNFTWVDGIRFGTVRWSPDPDKGRFFIKKGCHPPEEFRNKYELVRKNGGILANAPLAGHIGTFGVDPYNRSKNADGRGSKGAIILKTKTHTCDYLPNNAQILEYIDRPKKVEYFFEDVLMVSIYYSIPFLSELSNERFLAKIKEWGFRHFSMNNPFKKGWNDLSPTEQEFGGAPQQDAKIGEAQFYATEAFVADHIGVARDNSYRLQGEMGDMPFTRTLYQYKEVDTNNRTKFDAYIGASLADVGNQKRTVKKEVESKPVTIPFTTYDNSGAVSKLAM
jgi:hypothetical protein